MQILVADDELAVREALRRVLEAEGYEVLLATDGAWRRSTPSRARRPDAAVVDVMMPGLDGLEVCRRLRARGNTTPILLLTADATSRTVSPGSTPAPTTTCSKPFSIDELLARLRALLRRHAGSPRESSPTPTSMLDTSSHKAVRGDRPLELTRTEFLLLELFLRSPERVLSRSEILTAVWGYDFGPTSNSLEVYVGYLRRKLEADGEPRLAADGARRRLRPAGGGAEAQPSRRPPHVARGRRDRAAAERVHVRPRQATSSTRELDSTLRDRVVLLGPEVRAELSGGKPSA